MLKPAPAQVAARRAAVRAELPRRSWNAIISYMYRTSSETKDITRVFGPRLNSVYIDKKRMAYKTWEK